jgi:hypothetical protein
VESVNKKKVLYISGLINVVVWVATLINVIIVFPLNAENAWIYGLIIMAGALVTYFLGVFLVEGIRLETIGTIIIVVGEIFVIAYFSIKLGSTWIYPYIVFPIITFCALMVFAYYHDREIIPNHNAYNISIMLISGALFFWMVEAAVRIPDLFQQANVPIWGLIIMVAGVLLYAFTTWKIFKKPSYIMALSGAFIINIGLLMVELFYRMHELTGIFMLIFLPPAAVFFLLIYLNYRISPID